MKLRTVCKSKIHHAVVTGADLHYEGSIGIDRALGYGLKFPTAFGDTHLGRIGRR